MNSQIWKKVCKIVNKKNRKENKAMKYNNRKQCKFQKKAKNSVTKVQKIEMINLKIKTKNNRRTANS